MNRIQVVYGKVKLGLLALICELAFLGPPLPRSLAAEEPKGANAKVRSTKLLEIPRATAGRAQAAIANDDGLYLAGTRWNKKDNSDLWLWRVDRQGNKFWEKSVARQKNNEGLKILGLLQGGNDPTAANRSPSIDVVYRQGIVTHIASFKPSGEQIEEREFKVPSGSEGLFAVDADQFIVFGDHGSAGNKESVWAAKLKPDGELLWQQSFDTKSDDADKQATKTDEEAKAPRGFLRLSLLTGGTLLPDGSYVLVGQTGVYNKFGQGESKLWLLRLDEAGKKLDEKFIDGGRVFGSGGFDRIASSAMGVVVPYTTSQLPPIGNVPTNQLPAFPLHFAAFTATLDERWDKPLATTSMPGAGTITGPPPFVALTAGISELMIRGIGESGEVLWDTKASVPDSSLLPLAAIQMGDKVIAVANCSRVGRRDDDYVDQVLLVEIAVPAR